MNRFFIYSGIYIITLVSYILFNNISGFETIVFFIFLLSSVILVFAHEELPNPKYMKILKVKQYEEKRINIFGYSMSVILILGSLIFSSLTIYFKLNIGVSSLIVWPILSLIFFLTSNYFTLKTFSDNLFNYLNSKVQIESSLLKDIIKFTISNLNNSDTATELEDKLIIKFSNNIRIPLLHETYSIILEYIKLQNDPISPEEVSEANKI